MNLLKNLFKKNNGTVSNETAIAIDERIPDPQFESIFVDDDPPEADVEIKKCISLKPFLEKNFSSSGFQTGYDFHNAQSFENGVLNIRAEFQHMLSLIIDEREREIYDIEINKIQIEGIFEVTNKQLELRIKKLIDTIDKCKMEIQFSNEGKGLIEMPVNKFKEGFEKGMNQYFNEKHIARSTGLFD